MGNWFEKAFLRNEWNFFQNHQKKTFFRKYLEANINKKLCQKTSKMDF